MLVTICVSSLPKGDRQLAGFVPAEAKFVPGLALRIVRFSLQFPQGVSLGLASGGQSSGGPDNYA